MVLRLRGGGKKRKKKVYTTPKKIKHKRVKIKLAILKYYKVDDDGKINRLRRECPADICGAGVFMGNHYDRQYCGKCGLTYKFAPEDIKKPTPKAAVKDDAKGAADKAAAGKKKGKK